jgi:large repetitive protein
MPGGTRASGWHIRVSLPALLTAGLLALMVFGQPAIAARASRADKPVPVPSLGGLPPTVAPLPASAERSHASSPKSSPQAAVGTILNVGALPTGIAATNSTAYVANASSNTVSVINLAVSPPVVSGPPISVGAFPAALALSGDNSQLFVANFHGNSLSIVNTSTDAVTNTVPVGSNPDAVLEVGSSVYVSNLESGTLSVVNPANGTAGTPITLPSGGSGQAAPSGMAAIGSILYVEDVRNGRVDEVNTANGSTTGTVAVGTEPADLSIGGSTGYATNPGSDSVSVLNMTPTPPTLTTTTTVGTSPYGVAASSSSLGEAFVSNSGSDNVDVLDSSTHAVVGTPVTVGSVPDDAVLTPDGTKLLISNESDGTVQVLSVNQPPTISVPGAQTAGNNPNTLVFSSANSNAVTVGDGDGGTGPVQVTASVSHGTVTLGSTTGLTINSGSNGSSSVTFTGTVANVNAALSGLSYLATASYSGSDSLSVSVNDLGNTANIGKPETASSSVAISVLAPPTTTTTPSYSGAVGNTTFGVGTTPSQPDTSTSGNLLTDSGATDPNSRTLSVVTSGNPITTTGGGKVTVNSTGTFTYISGPGYTGTDSFMFTITDGISTTTATAHVVVANTVWYVNDSLGTNGNGTSTSPFNTLASVNPASSTGAYVFLFGTGTTYAGGITLKASQTLVGQSVGLVVASQTVVTASGSNPTITNSAGAGVTLGEGATVMGVTVSGTSGAGIIGAVNSATIAGSVSITNTTGPSFDITGGTTGTVSDAAVIDETAKETTADALAVSGRSGGAVNQTGAITGGVGLTNNTGASIAISGGMTASTGTLKAFVATGGGAVTLTGSGNTLTTTTATALDVEGTAIGASGLTFHSINTGSVSAGPLNGILLIGTGTAGGVTVTGDGSATVGGDGSGGTIFATGNAATDDAAIEIGTPDLLSSTVPNPVGPMIFNDMAIQKAGTANNDAVFVDNAATFTFGYSTITNEDFGVYLTGFGSSGTQFNIVGNRLTGSADAPIYVAYPDESANDITTGLDQGYVNDNTIGNSGVTNSGSTGSAGMDISEQGSGTLTVNVENNTITQIADSYGFNAGNGPNGGALNLTLASNSITLSSATSFDAINTLEASTGSMCVHATSNTAHAASTNDQGLGIDAVGFVAGSASPVAYVLQGYTGSTTDAGGSVESYLESTNTLSGPNSGDGAAAGSDTGGADDFVNGTCSTSFGSAPAITAPSPAAPSSPSAAAPAAGSGSATGATPGAPAITSKHTSHKRTSKRRHHRAHHKRVTKKLRNHTRQRGIDIHRAVGAIVHVSSAAVRGVTAR